MEAPRAEFPLEEIEILWIGPIPHEDRLSWIAYHHHVSVLLATERSQNLILRLIDILGLVNTYVSVLPAIEVGDLWTFDEEPIRQQQEIVEIQGVGSAQSPVVDFVDQPVSAVCEHLW